MLHVFKCDLHIHTCLSPCGDLNMYPRAIVRKAHELGLDCIAVCDHNTAENVSFVKKAALHSPLKVIPGMEITSREEVHILAFFDNLENLLSLQEIVYAHLPGENDEERFGCQAIVNENDEVEGFSNRLLIGATTLPLTDIVEAIHKRGGLAIAAHIDRESFSVIGQLGFVSREMQFDALEVSARLSLKEARRVFPSLSEWSLISSSDAHFIEDIGRAYTQLLVEAPTVEELKLALKNEKGRVVFTEE